MKKQLLLAEKGEWDPFKLKITKVSEEFYVITTTKYLWETTKKFSNTSFITFLDGAKEGLVKEKNNRTLQITNRKCDGSHCIKCEIFTTENQHRHWKLVYNCRSIKWICLIFLPDGLLKTILYVCPYTLYMDNIILFIISS